MSNDRKRGRSAQKSHSAIGQSAIHIQSVNLRTILCTSHSQTVSEICCLIQKAPRLPWQCAFFMAATVLDPRHIGQLQFPGPPLRLLPLRAKSAAFWHLSGGSPGVSMSFLSQHELTSKIQDVVSQPSRIAVAFWGGGACDLLQLPENLAGYRIACDGYSGFCNPSTLKELLDRRAKLVNVPGLHAKVYLSDSKMVACSANASAGGLRENNEAGIYSEAPEHLEAARVWFDKLFENGSPIDDNDLDEIEILWANCRNHRPIRMKIPEAIVMQSDDLEDRNIRVYIYSDEEAPEEHQNLHAQSEYQGIEYFWGAESDRFKQGETLFCFAATPAADSKPTSVSVSYDSAWTVLGMVGQGGVVIWPLIESDMLSKSAVADRGWETIVPLIELAVKRGKLSVDSDPIPLPEFAKIIAEISSQLAPEDGAMAQHLGKIHQESVREAYRLLVAEGPKLGFKQSLMLPKTPNKGKYFVNWGLKTDIPFAFIVNQQHLLFYMRKSAPQDLVNAAQWPGFKFEPASKGEHTMKIRDVDHAQAVIDLIRKYRRLLPA